MAHINSTPGFTAAFGLQGDQTTSAAFSQLDSIIGRQGGTSAAGLRRTRAVVNRRGGDGDIQGRLNAQEALTAENRRVSDLGLVEAGIVKPALQKRQLDIQKLQGEVLAQGGRAAIRQQLATGLGGVFSMVADIRKAFKLQQEKKGEGDGETEDQATDIFGNPI